MTDEKPSYYAIIPAGVRYDKELIPSAKLLYGEITALCNKEGYCWASNRYFAELYETSIRNVNNWVSNLKDRGYIKVELVYGEGSRVVMSRKIYLAFHEGMKKSSVPHEEKCMTPHEEKCTDNTTEYNNTINTIVAPVVAAKKPKLSPAESEAYKSIVDTFYDVPESWELINSQGVGPKVREMKAVKDIAKRIACLCPEHPGDFARTAVLTFVDETRKDKRGIQASATPCSLNTGWIWGRVLTAMQGYKTEEDSVQRMRDIEAGLIVPDVRI